MAEPLPSSGALDAASWNILQVNAQRALQTHDHHDQRLSGLAISPQARLEIASLDATQLRLAGRDVGQALAAQLSIAGDTVPGDLEVQGNLVLRQPLEVGGVVTPRPSPRTATYRAADGRVVETDSTTLQWGRWHDLLSFNINISQATVGLVHFSGDFEPYVDPHNSRDPSCVLAPFVRLDSFPPLGLVDLATLAEPTDRAAWLRLAAAPERAHPLNVLSHPGVHSPFGQLPYGLSDGKGITEPFTALLAVPLPPGSSTLLLRAAYAPQAVARVTMTLVLVPP